MIEFKFAITFISKCATYFISLFIQHGRCSMFSNVWNKIYWRNTGVYFLKEITVFSEYSVKMLLKACGLKRCIYKCLCRHFSSFRSKYFFRFLYYFVQVFLPLTKMKQSLLKCLHIKNIKSIKRCIIQVYNSVIWYSSTY